MIMLTTFVRHPKGLMRSERGTSMIEFALLAPIFLFLMVGLIEVGRYTYYGIVAAHAARAGAQYGSQSLIAAANTSGIDNAALNDTGSPSTWSAHHTIICENNGLPVTCPAGGSGVANATLVYYVQVQVSGKVNALLNYPGIPTSSTISSTATLRINE